ncbi:hypothetical protein NDU88_002499 [Pleurodeles waltl]|uniref:Myb/SANT-like DNA-binding domain-containing protein n=1 Tax=Pleurodeles waltl TaxID=8319 RepID=A0AAV7M2M4_PLEWA|nr:hypothetical protein NDU88_002499 [Pleurodeles waltl]
MAAATGERAPAFTSEELEKLVDGVLPQYALLYGPPDQQVSAHQKIDIWRAIAKDVRALGVHNRRGTHCRKRWEDIRRGSRKTAEALLGMASQRRRSASRQLTPLMSRILAVAYPDLDGRVRTSQQTQGASSGGGEVALEHEGAASHMAPDGHATDSDFTSETEGEGGSTTGTRGDISDTDTSSEGSFLVVAATSVPTATTGTAATQRTSSALQAAPQRSPRARSHTKAGISFAPGTSGPAPVTPAALSEEVIDLLRTLIVGQSTLLNAIQGVEREVHRSNAYLEGIDSEYLNKINITKIDDTTKSSLDDPITSNEITNVNNGHKARKAAGPHWFPASFYQTWGPFLITFFSSTGMIKGTTAEATMIGIPKEGKDPSNSRKLPPPFP